MAGLSISSAWSETTEFLQREFGLLFLIAFLLISLPGLVLQYLMPTPEPEALTGFDEMARAMEGLLLYVPVVVILGMIGTIAITYLAIRPGASAGEALAVGARRFVMLLIAGLLLTLVAIAAVVPSFLLILPTDGGDVPVGSILLLVFFYLILFLLFWVKLMLITPVAAVESGGPLTLIARSWTLSGGHFWKLLGFVVLFWIAATVAIMVVSVVLALILTLFLGAPLPGTASFFALNLVTAAVQAVVSMAFTVAIGRIYAQLVGEIDADIFA